jgi:hypothetical protein
MQPPRRDTRPVDEKKGHRLDACGLFREFFNQ